MARKKRAALAEAREAERTVEEVESARTRLRARGREAMGVTGEEAAPPLREAVRGSGVGWYPLLALGLLVIVDEFQGVAFGILGPEISRALGISRTGLAALVAVKTLAISLATLPMAAYVQRIPRRGIVAIVTAFAWSAATMFTGIVRGFWSMLGILVADGTTTGSVRAVHTPLLIDSYPPEVRVRGLSFYRGADYVGQVLAPLLVGGLTAVLGFTWRGVFLVMGVVSLAAAVFSVRLRDPGFGKWDTSRVREVVREDAGATAEGEDDEIDLGFFEIVRRLMLIPTIRKILIVNGVLGAMIIPLATYMAFFLDEKWNLGPGARGVFSAATPLFAIAALSVFGQRGEALFRADPARLIRTASWLFLAGIVALPLAILSPWFWLMFVFFGLSSALFATMGPALTLSILGIIPAKMRPHAAALSGIFLAAVGGFGGLILLGGIDRRFGLSGAIVALSAPGVIAMLILRTCARTINGDLNRMVDEIVEEEELRTMRGSGAHLPMLACRHIDFAYDQLQVLFDVNFAVDEGETVGLLGTNGAGKSTLLRVISGLGLPLRGSVRLRGVDITYVDPARRVGLGISQIAGGKATFPRLTVVENLRATGFSLGRDRAAVDRGIEATFDAFPRLAQRRNQPAGTLSGGENQMLALGKALILQPRLLLIDELSLGLAPKVVAELLDMVRRINSKGTAVVLVEQSVNVALSLVEHAYFMEKGQIRFDGRSSELLARDDLLRSVFLEGASKGLARGDRAGSNAKALRTPRGGKKR